MKKLVLMAALAVVLCGRAEEPAPRVSELANKGWTFFKGSQAGAEAVAFDDSSWEQVNLPHSASIPYWMELEVYEGDTWYRKAFEVPAAATGSPALAEYDCDYDATVSGKEVLTPKPDPEPKLTGAAVFGVRPGKPIRYCATAKGDQPITFSANGLPAGVSIDPETGWILGRAPEVKGDVTVAVTAVNAKGKDTRILTLRVGDEICLTPPMGWNSWYVHSEGVSEQAIRDMATAMKEKGLQASGWSYVNIDDCWMGERDPQTRRIQANGKFNDMKAMVGYVNSLGLKVGIYSTPWMSTFAGYIGGTAPNEAGDYSEYYLPENERRNPYQVFGRFPNGIKKSICEVGPVWFVDRDAKQFADWGIDYVKYDWLEWDLLTDTEKREGRQPVRFTKNKTAEHGITQRFYNDFRSLDRDIVISLSPGHQPSEDAFVREHCNLWRLTEDIHADWKRLIAPFDDELVKRLEQTRPGSYGDLDMLQIGPMGIPNRAEKVFRPSRLTPAEQYLQVTLWSLLTQPLLLSCNIPTMDEFDLNLVTNDEVLAVNQDTLCRQGYRIKNKKGVFEIWTKELADGSKAVGLFNLSAKDQVLTFSAEELGMTGKIRDLWRQKEIGTLKDSFSVKVSSHGAVLLKISPEAQIQPGAIWPDDRGVHINAHGGGVVFHEGTYYWFGEHKVAGDAGNRAQVGVHVYSSKDLYDWKDEGIALKVSDDPESDITKGCIIERPKVIYNAKTGQFVMWFHLELKGQGYDAARSGIAVADQPTGPYTFIRSIRPNAGHWPLNVSEAQKDPASIEQTKLENEAFSGGPSPKHEQFNILGSHFAGGQMARDMNLFVDDDGKAYHIYSSEHNSTLHISLLTDDYLDHEGVYTRNFPFRWMEAPALFKRNGKYYLVASGCTGWAPNAARSAVADSILGPWTELKNPCVGMNPQNQLGPEKTFGGQSTCVFAVQGIEDAYIAMFDIWRPEDAIDGRYVWLPVKFDDDGFHIQWADTWSLDCFNAGN